MSTMTIKHPVAPHSCPWCGRLRHGSNPVRIGDGLYCICAECGRQRRAYLDPASRAIGPWERHAGPAALDSGGAP